jgi:PPM family protein phosphatase
VDGDGFCARCGHERVPRARDHLEVAASPRLAAVSGRGTGHHRNDDSVALATAPEGDVLVVCDGVSNSQRADEAAEAAAAACATLRDAVGRGAGDDRAAVEAAIGAAHVAVRALPYTRGGRDDPPEATIVAAVRRGRRLTVGWLGDSRAYLLVPAGARQLTEDHSWVNEVVAAGRMTRAEALAAPLAHAITRTLGGPVGPAATGDEPSLADFDIPPGPGYLVLCSDGLWNAAPDPGRLAEVAGRHPPGTDALGVARGLMAYAREQGSRDDITAAVLCL